MTRLQVSHLSRTYGLPAPVARLLASLIYGEGRE